MAPLPVLKFVFLGIRQLTKPVAKHVIARANAKRGITRRICIGLGSISLGLSGVIAEWSNNEMYKQIENNRKNEKEKRKAVEATLKLESTAFERSGKESSLVEKLAPRGKDKTVLSSPVVGIHLDTPEPMETPKPANVIASAMPRSRSLLEVLTYGPKPKETDTYNSRVFVYPRNLAGGVARIFIRQSYRSAWAVFRTTFFSPFPEEKLVNAGVDLLIELFAYIILASLLFWELSVQSKANVAKEARIDEMEMKLNRLIEVMHLDCRDDFMKNTPQPSPEPGKKLNELWNSVWCGLNSMYGGFCALFGISCEKGCL